MSVRRSAARPDPPAADAAARRLALIAADLGVAPAASGPAFPDVAGDVAETVEPWWADHTRVADQPDARPSLSLVPQVPPAPAEPTPPALPEPGRHAARRRRPRPGRPAVLAPIADRLPTLGMAQVAVVALAVALGLAVTTWWVLRDRPESLAPVAAEPTAPLVATTPTAPGATVPSASGVAGAPAPSTGTVTVDVAGEVRRPGIVVLDAGARVTDALAAAGGPRKGVDLTPLNLARVLVDGEQIVVGGPARPPAAAGASGSGSGAVPGPLVNLNTAGQAELESLPEVGPVTAQSIIAWRDAHGGFTSVDELLEVDGIGAKTLEQITPHVTV